MNECAYVYRKKEFSKKKKNLMVFKLSQLWILRYIYINFGRISAKLLATG